MTTPDLDLLDLAEAIATVLRRQLDAFAAETVVLTRDEAALALGVIEGAAEAIKREQGGGGG